MTRIDQMDRLHMTGHEDDEQDECRAGTATGPGGMMNDDILLDKFDLAQEHTEALDTWKRTDKCTPWEDFWNVWLCRAQVLKVAEWAKGNNCAPLQADGKRTYTAHLVLPRDAWQALKAAREGK